MRNVKDPNVCLMAADSSADGKRGNEPSKFSFSIYPSLSTFTLGVDIIFFFQNFTAAYLTGNCSTIQAPYAVSFS